jgi:hypothetical protein
MMNHTVKTLEVNEKVEEESLDFLFFFDSLCPLSSKSLLKKPIGLERSEGKDLWPSHPIGFEKNVKEREDSMRFLPIERL